MARMGSQAVPRFYSSEPLFGGVAPEVMEASLLRLAAENEQYLSELPGQAGCCKESRTVGEAPRGWSSPLMSCIRLNSMTLTHSVSCFLFFFFPSEFIFLLAEKWHLDHSARYQAVELLER